MSYIFWNYRGLGSDTVVHALYELIRKYWPSMIFLSKTKMKDHRIDGVRKMMGFKAGFNVSPIGKSGGLCLWWADHLKVDIRFSSKYVVDAWVQSEGEAQWVSVTGVYGALYRGEKAQFWDWMATNLRPSSLPWLCGSNFNEFLWDYEKSGGSTVLYN